MIMIPVNNRSTLIIWSWWPVNNRSTLIIWSWWPVNNRSTVIIWSWWPVNNRSTLIIWSWWHINNRSTLTITGKITYGIIMVLSLLIHLNERNLNLIYLILVILTKGVEMKLYNEGASSVKALWYMIVLLNLLVW